MLNESSRVAGPFDGDDVTTALPFDFKVFAESDLAVLITDNAGAQTTAVLDVDYTVTLNADQEVDPGGTVTLTDPLATGYTCAVVSDLPYDQPLDLQNAGRFHAQRIEDALDRVVMQIQQGVDSLSRCVRAPAGETLTTLPGAAARANKIVAFNADGDPMVVSFEDAGAVSTTQVYEQVFTASASQTVFALTLFSYVPGNNALTVTMNGLQLMRGVDYTEDNPTQFTLLVAAASGDHVVARAGIDTGQSIDASEVVYTPAGTGAVATNVQDRLRELHSVTDYGAVGDGVTDDTAAIQAAIDAVAAAGGGDLIFPPGVFATGPLSITDHRVRLIGAGAGWFSGTHTERGTTLLYNGAAAGTMLTLSSVSGVLNEKISDCAILGIAIDGDEVAGTGLLVASVNRCEFDVSIAGCTSVQCEWKTVATLADTTNNQHNLVRYMRVKALNTANGIKFDTDVLPGNTSFNRFGYLYAQHADGYGVRIGNTDNNVFDHIVASRSSGTGIGIVLGAGDNTTRLNCRANQILMCSPGDGGLTAEGTPSDTLPSSENRIWYYDKDNATSDPTIETDAILAWGTTDSVFSNFGFVAAGFGNSAANVINATAQAISASFPVVIAAGNGNHLQLDNGNSGKWNFKVDATTGQFSLVRAGGTGLLALETAYLGNYADDAAAAAGSVAVGELYRNGSVLMIRVA